MNKSIKYLLGAALISTALNTGAQTVSDSKFAVKVNAEIGLGNSISSSSPSSAMTSKANAGNYGVDFGYTFWQKGKNAMEVNVGVAYSPASLTLELDKFNYNYSASASADMDGNTYQRYYEIGYLKEKVNVGRFTLPIYLDYSYKCNDWVKIHADVGFRLGFKTSCSISGVEGNAYSYGIYPQYDNLKIDEPYLNDFGTKALSESGKREPQANGFDASFLVGIGAEFRLYGPLWCDIAFRYNAGFTNLFKGAYNLASINETSAPVTYTVAGGQQVNALSDYLSSSKLNMIGLRIGLSYKF